ncbi:sec20 domain-containing protein [Hirsutella rhossiliensis]|uniref:Sec20 domain-containing protein n=1 Tax=Hirsutella rhossiliensis TaxID=111463 RepID=A0A9P8MY90_9HYPO|nr:sec20 domain-containing protein [Hirsutella rhossiliensis]KAH0963450.1 sec20 domain-containing protein [Hirsutella rhossiliensis]
MSLQGLQERLTALQETTTQLRDLIDRLSNLKFQPGSVPLDTEEENSPSGELSAEIGQILRSGLEEQELLQEEARYARPEGHDKARLEDGIERLGSQLASHRAAFRKARLAAKKSLEQAQRLERHLLVRSLSMPVSECESPTSANGEAPMPIIRRTPRHTLQQSSLSQEDRQTVGASSNVTTALRRTHDLMAAELSRSEFAHQTLTESSAALKQLNESYTSLDSMLASSRDLLGTLLRSQKSDTWYLQTALYMLLTTAAWLVFRRILYGPLWWLVWLPIRILFGAGTKAGGAMLRGRGDGAGESVKVPVGGQEGRIPVDGLPDDDLPIAQVRHETRDPDEVDLESVVEKVREMVEDMESTYGRSDSNEHGNTKKRMWEETEGVGDQAYTRDEL